MPQPYDLLLRHALLLPEPGLGPAIPDGFLLIDKGRVHSLGPMAELPAGLTPKRIIDATNCLLMPGLVNGHCHAAMTLFRGLADDLPLLDWLYKHIFPAEARLVDEEMVSWCSKLAAAEMLLSGTTTVADGYFFAHAAARAFHEAGLRAVAAQGVIDFPAPGVPDPADNISAAARHIAACQGLTGITPAIFCHSAYTCGPDTLRAAKDLARAQGVKLFLHLAESADEVKQIQGQRGFPPVPYLEGLGLLDRDTVLVHGVHLGREDIALLAERGTGLVTCPESNMKLASGIAPVPGLLAAGVPLALGTDGPASNNDLDMLGEMGSLARLHKVASHDPTVLPASQVLGMATWGGATVLGLGEQVGRLRPGMAADCILIDLDQPHLTPFYGPELLVYAARGGDVRMTIVNGRVVMEAGRVLSFDLAEAMARVRHLHADLRGGKQGLP